MGTSAKSTQSQSNTPQAKDDSYAWGVGDLLHAGAGNVLTLDVMANDMGGKARSLWSLDDGNGHPEATDTDLVVADPASVYEDTALNNLGVCDRIAIVNGKVCLDLSNSLAKLGLSDVSAMPAGAHIQDTFVYAIRMGNGTLSQATVTVDIWGQNGCATIVGITTGTTDEDASAPANGALIVSDPNPTEACMLAASGATAKGSWSVAGDGHWQYQANSAAENHLAAGVHDSDSFTVTSLDGSASQTVTIDIVGINDVAAIGGADTAVVSEDNVLSASGQLSVSDADDGESAFQSEALSGAYGTLTLDAAGNWTYALDNAAIQILAASDHLADTFQVHSLDGTATHAIVVTVNGSYDADSDTSHDFDALTGSATGALGSHGDDVLNGTDGVDGSGGTINGGPGSDSVYASGGNDLVLGGSDEDKLYGQAGDDTIWGKGGADVLFGGSGNDILEGGGSDDVLWGGSGNDVFRYTAVNDSNGASLDVIADFHHGCDRIDVSAIDANVGDADDSAFVWGGSSATAHGVWFSLSGADTVLHFDTDGNAANDEMTVMLSGTGLFLSAADFVL